MITITVAGDCSWWYCLIIEICKWSCGGCCGRSCWHIRTIRTIWTNIFCTEIGRCCCSWSGCCRLIIIINIRVCIIISTIRSLIAIKLRRRRWRFNNWWKLFPLNKITNSTRLWNWWKSICPKFTCNIWGGQSFRFSRWWWLKHVYQRTIILSGILIAITIICIVVHRQVLANVRVELIEIVNCWLIYIRIRCLYITW